jgi:hypothetical protein
VAKIAYSYVTLNIRTKAKVIIIFIISEIKDIIDRIFSLFLAIKNEAYPKELVNNKTVIETKYNALSVSLYFGIKDINVGKNTTAKKTNPYDNVTKLTFNL